MVKGVCGWNDRPSVSAACGEWVSKVRPQALVERNSSGKDSAGSNGSVCRLAICGRVRYRWSGECSV